MMYTQHYSNMTQVVHFFWMFSFIFGGLHHYFYTLCMISNHTPGGSNIPIEIIYIADTMHIVPYIPPRHVIVEYNMTVLSIQPLLFPYIIIIIPFILTENSKAVSVGHFEAGNGTVLLGQVNCYGSEQRLRYCKAPEIGKYKCEHSEDAGVICTASKDELLY